MDVRIDAAGKNEEVACVHLFFGDITLEVVSDLDYPPLAAPNIAPPSPVGRDDVTVLDQQSHGDQSLACTRRSVERDELSASQAPRGPPKAFPRKRLPSIVEAPESAGTSRDHQYAVMQALVCYHACMTRQLTIRGVPEEVAARLARISEERGRSVNATVLEILQGAVGVQERRERLQRMATWTDQDMVEFQRALKAQRVIDEELWS